MAKQMRAQWNTHRTYTAAGQQIVAELVADDDRGRTGEGGIVFNDLARGIGGFIPLSVGAYVKDERRLRDLTMANYDLGNYHSDSRALSLAWVEPVPVPPMTEQERRDRAIPFGQPGYRG